MGDNLCFGKQFVSLKSLPVSQCITHLSFLPIQDGNIFICDKKKMDGIPARDYDDEPLHVTPGLCYSPTDVAGEQV